MYIKINRTKSIFDHVVAFFGLIILLPLFLGVALGILIDDKGPVFFRQLRVGRGGKLFRVYKFRSMRNSRPNEEGTFEPGNDARITSFGRLIRKSKIDELPQLINVLKGDMSLVGPRPEIKKWVDEFPDQWKIILQVKPGVTDKASLQFRNEESLLAASENPEITYRNEILPAKMALNETYVENQSFSGDLEIILKTLYVLFTHK